MSQGICSQTVLIVAGLVAVCGVGAQAVPIITVPVVPVGNPGNAGDSRYGGYGAVGYTFNMGKYEVTAWQYTVFLNAVARTDPYELYNTKMGSTFNRGAIIQRVSSSGDYHYGVAADWANRPVNYVSWGDAARFANWLHNGQPTGAQGLSTTEDGSYFLNGAVGYTDLMAVTRKAGATWAIPTEDEWYKAAYQKNDGVTGNYWDYPTGTNAVPSNLLSNPDPGNSANYYSGGYTIDGPYYRTEVGDFENSDSPYGTFDQGGNVLEWNEAIIAGLYRGLRGGSFTDIGYDLSAAPHVGDHPSQEFDAIGFRVSEVPEPPTIVMLALVVGGFIRGRRA